MVKATADELDINTYLVGGCIRDKLLGRENEDLDFVVDKNADAFVRHLSIKYNLPEPVFLERSQAWTLTVNDYNVDIINANIIYTPLTQKFEESSLEGDEEFSTSLDDAFRRDLTVNSLMYDVRSGKLVDPTRRGLKDLKNRELNTIINPRVKYRIHAPDMLRTLRFVATLGFKLGSGMMEAMKANAWRVLPRDEGGDVSSRRIRRELRKAAVSLDTWNMMKRLLAETTLADYLANDIKDVEDDMRGAIEYPELKDIPIGQRVAAVEPKAPIDKLEIIDEPDDSLALTSQESNFWKGIVNQMLEAGYTIEEIKADIIANNPAAPSIDTILKSFQQVVTAQGWPIDNMMSYGPAGSCVGDDTEMTNTLKNQQEKIRQKEIQKKKDELKQSLSLELANVADACDERELTHFADLIDDCIVTL
jgi:tRNA nucleotidyltransferase/poly(A) polymerase